MLPVGSTGAYVCTGSNLFKLDSALFASCGLVTRPAAIELRKLSSDEVGRLLWQGRLIGPWSLSSGCQDYVGVAANR